MTQTLPAVEIDIAVKVVLIVDVVIRSFGTCWKIRVKCLKARIFIFKRLFQSALHFDSLYKKQKKELMFNFHFGIFSQKNSLKLYCFPRNIGRLLPLR